MTLQLQGLVAAVTGSASGIGLATAIMLRDNGVTVFGLDLQRGALDESITWIECDVTKADVIDQAFKKIESATNQLNTVVNSAGIGAVGTIEQATEDEWARVYDTNVVGMARVSSRALPLMRRSQHGSIVNICSIAATVGLPDRAVYSASKGAVLSLTKAMAADLIKDKIRVNCVNPGTADTPWVARLLAQAADPVAERQALNARQPMGRLVSPEEVASAVCFLASPTQASTTGASLAVDGGMDGLRTRARTQ
jgi:NAD(P)-dependent dehydrogenase (short-subunit alcohol dehydrogenase family)